MRHSPTQADDARADAGRTTLGTLRWGLPQYQDARKWWTHSLRDHPHVRLLCSADSESLWGVFASKPSELLPERGDELVLVPREKGKETELIVATVDDASEMTARYRMLSLTIQ